MPSHPTYHRTIDPLELAQLAQQWGAPLVRQITLDVDDPFLTGNHQLLTANNRRAEICYVMHRGRPEDGLLRHLKTFYPAGAYRLPTGGIHVGESVMHTLQREIYEETGLRAGEAPGEVKLQRLLGILGYTLQHRQLGPVEFATYFFLVEMPAGAELQPQDEDEHIGGWEWCTPAQLPAVAAGLGDVHTRSTTLADLGRFRDSGHRVVAELLAVEVPMISH